MTDRISQTLELQHGPHSLFYVGVLLFNSDV